VPVLAAVAGLGLVFKDDDFIAFSVFLHHGQYPGAFNERFTRGDFIAIGDEQYLIEFHGAAYGRIQPLDVYGLAFGYPVLFAACFNYRVNFGPRLSESNNFLKNTIQRLIVTDL
jgi:hypothetical protein